MIKKEIKEFFAKKGSYYEQGSHISEQKHDSHDAHGHDDHGDAHLKKYALEKFKSRRSIRKFSSTPIHWDVIYQIIEGALNAPAAGNIQNYNVIVVEDKKKRHELGKVAFQQYWLSEAPTLLVVVRDNSHLCQMYPNEGQTYAIQNSAAFIENILMMAHFYDLGACWVEAYDNQVMKEFLGIPMEKVVDAIIPIGYPLENPKISKDDMVTKVFFESYGNKSRGGHH